MTWTPKVGEWVVLIDASAFGACRVIEIKPDGLLTVRGPIDGGFCWDSSVRPATIDEIPGNTVSEKEHDMALHKAGHFRGEFTTHDWAAFWEWVAIGVDRRREAPCE